MDVVSSKAVHGENIAPSSRLRYRDLYTFKAVATPMHLLADQLIRGSLAAAARFASLLLDNEFHKIRQFFRD